MIYDDNGNMKLKLGYVLNFNNYMNKTFKYGLAINGKVETRNTTSEDYDKLYKAVSADQFVKQEGGICWDYVIYEAQWFKDNIPELNIKTWYVIFDKEPDYPTHTFITFKYNDVYVLFESSFKKVQGMYYAKSEKDLINFILYNMNNHNYDSYVFNYNPLDKRIPGMNCMEFMKFVEDNGKEVRHKFNSNFNITKITKENVNKI